MAERLTLHAIQDTTKKFYSQFCGTKISELQQGIYFVCSEERDALLKGFGCKYTIYIFVKDNLCIVSYSPKHKQFIEQIKQCNTNEIIKAVNQKYQLKKMQLMIFHEEVVKQYGAARILKDIDYPLYEAFFRAANPGADPTGWLYEYFMEKVSKECFVGYPLYGKLVSVCDAPDMPYMEDKVQHTGISTLIEERRNGYARCTAALAANHLIENGICPQWECVADNRASIELAMSIGYKKYGIAYILEEN